MGTIQSSELRTFEQRFGERCPFCGRGWGSAERCDPVPAEFQWRDSNRHLFIRVEFPARSCVVCLSLFTPRTHNRVTCSESCSSTHRRLINNAASRRRNGRRRQKLIVVA